MPRYHFNLRDDLDAADEEGMELPDLAAAREQAITEARQIACASLKEQGRINLSHYIEVTDSGGEPLFRLPFREAMKIIG